MRLLCMEMGGVWGIVCCYVRVLCLRELRYYFCICPATYSYLMRATADDVSDVVDVYNGTTGAWSTARLSVARFNVAAASVGNVALFAGGSINFSAFGVQGGVGRCLFLRAC